MYAIIIKIIIPCPQMKLILLLNMLAHFYKYVNKCHFLIYPQNFKLILYKADSNLLYHFTLSIFPYIIFFNVISFQKLTTMYN